MSGRRTAVDVSAARELARAIRREALGMTHRAGSSHIASALSIAELLAALYSGVLRVDPASPEAPGRDRFILSKGHACAALYAALALRGFFPLQRLRDFCRDGAALAGHATHLNVPGVEVSTGSLGHGLAIGCGMALAAKRDGASYRVFVLLSDGECDEGSVWEAALFAAHHRLDNLVALIDSNRMQSLGAVSQVLELEPFADKWRAFSWRVAEIDGHDLAALGGALGALPWQPGKPSCLLARTVKGSGVSFMEQRIEWHYRSPDAAALAAALRELGGASDAFGKAETR